MLVKELNHMSATPDKTQCHCINVWYMGIHYMCMFSCYVIFILLYGLNDNVFIKILFHIFLLPLFIINIFNSFIITWQNNLNILDMMYRLHKKCIWHGMRLLSYFNPYLTNGFTHHYHLGVHLQFRDISSDF